MRFIRYILLVIAIVSELSGKAEYPMTLSVEMMEGAGHGTFAPYYIGANNQGRISQSDNSLVEVGLSTSRTVDGRWSYSWGVKVVFDDASSATYSRYDVNTGEWYANKRRPAYVWLQELYGRVDYRSLYLQAGLRETPSSLVDSELSSGDLVRGINARPLPQITAGLTGFQAVPHTNGWLRVECIFSFGKFMDDNWLEKHYNRYNNHICEGSYYMYRRLYLSTKRDKPMTFTLGMQAVSIYGGTTTSYAYGRVVSVEHHGSGISDFFKMIIPTEGGEDYYTGNSLGSWDLQLRYRAPWGGIFRGYHQRLWEMGSGIGFMNGFDGLWGLEYRSPRPGWIDGIVVEYLDFTNHSGPIHFDPADIDDCKIPYQTTGGDDYYNNYTYNSYAYYGMSMGTPFLKAPIYNLDGYPAYIDNVVRGFHVAVTGTIGKKFGYRMMGGYRRGWGAIRLPRVESVYDGSWMAEGRYKASGPKGDMQVTAAFGMDRGTMLGNNWGVMFGIKYDIKIGKR